MEGEFLTLNHAMSTWWHLAKGKTLHSWLLKLVSPLIIWHLWKARNFAIYEEIPIKSVSIIDAIR